MVGKVMLTSGALKCLACWWDVVAMDKGCCPSCLRDIDVLVGPVQYRARWIDKERQLCKLLVPHLGQTSMMVIILLSVCQ